MTARLGRSELLLTPPGEWALRAATPLDRYEVRAVGLRNRRDCAVVRSAFSETAGIFSHYLATIHYTHSPMADDIGTYVSADIIG